MTKENINLCFMLAGFAIGIGLMLCRQYRVKQEEQERLSKEADNEFEGVNASFSYKLVCAETAHGICKRLEEINKKYDAERNIVVFIKDSNGQPVKVRLS